MLKLFTGTPGSGKSYHMAQKIYFLLRLGKNVISTSDINLSLVTKNGRRKIGRFIYKPIYELSADYLMRFAANNHHRGKESQTIVFIDECQLIFNSRDYGAKDRRSWLQFFTSHRHYGYDFYLITQNDRMIDRQIRSLVEHEVKHRKVNNFLWFLPIKVFVAIETWYGHPGKHKINSQFVFFKKRLSKLYDSYTMFDDLVRDYGNQENEIENYKDYEMPLNQYSEKEDVAHRKQDENTTGFIYRFFLMPIKTAPIKTYIKRKNL